MARILMPGRKLTLYGIVILVISPMSSDMGRRATPPGGSGISGLPTVSTSICIDGFNLYYGALRGSFCQMA